ncbi:alkaline phosphatase family protein [Candidatus Enterococcus mansonii]|uniref:Sulfatase N-terminal domain-containing protein n=1 Tax=Candidatus Enterococcus mansonii TaxID=1834181 RepID=A0A242CE77_9ENTE|nr:alkaline phosphatase family protein [Enterococcus sp. 4G2_DIV0659]OTO08082.1 hypothetical protein A5880_002352 [Enterococcus sp. 4G2_DIV0659]
MEKGNNNQFYAISIIGFILFIISSFFQDVYNAMDTRAVSIELFLLGICAPIGLNVVLLVWGYLYADRLPGKKERRIAISQTYLITISITVGLFSMGISMYTQQLFLQMLTLFLAPQNSILVGVLAWIFLGSTIIEEFDKVSTKKQISILIFLTCLISLIPTFLSIASFLSKEYFYVILFFWPSYLFLIGRTIQKNKKTLDVLPKKSKRSFLIGSLVLDIGGLATLFFLLKYQGFFLGKVSYLTNLAFNLFPLLVAIGMVVMIVPMSFSIRFSLKSIYIKLFGIYLVTNHFLLREVLISDFLLTDEGFTSFFEVVIRILEISIGLLLSGYLLALLVDRTIHDSKEKKHSFSSVFLISLVTILVINFTLNMFSYLFDFKALFAWHHYFFWLMFLNLIFLTLIYLVLLSIINRLWLTILVFSVTFIALGFANYQKLILREEPLLPLDFSNITALPEIVQMVGVQKIMFVLLGIIVIFCVTLFIHKTLFSKKVFKLPFRIGLAVITIFILSSLTKALGDFRYASEWTMSMKLLKNLDYEPHPEGLKYSYNRNGPVLTFASMLKVETMKKPQNYSKDTLLKLQEKYQKRAVELNQNRQKTIKDQTVVYILSESFADPRNIPTVQIDKEPIPYIKSIMEETTSGHLFSMGYGGGTANIEFEALTSLSMDHFSPALTSAYLFLFPKHDNLPSVTRLFDTTTAIHPYTASTYKRDRAFEFLGFDNFYYEGSKRPLKYQEKLENHIYISDDSAFKETLDQIRSVDGGQFIQLTTMQNHTPYDEEIYENKFKAKGYLNHESIKKIETYTQGIHYTDKAMKQFIKEIDQMDKPVTIVFYGDHLPGIYKGDAVDEDKNHNLLHQTDYFIYSNQESKNVSKKYVTANMFTPMLLDQLNQQVTPYYALMTDVYQNLPGMELQKVMNDQGEYILEKELTKEQKELIHEYRLIQYDITAGEKYVYQGNNFFDYP